MSTDEKEVASMDSVWKFVNQWGPFSVTLLVVCWLVVYDMPRQREQVINTYVAEIKALRDYDRQMREKQWAHNADIHAKIIQAQDVSNKVGMETVYEIKRLREINEKILGAKQ